MAKERIIKGLQLIVTNLSQQAIGHKIQAKVFASQGFSKLEKKMPNIMQKKWVM